MENLQARAIQAENLREATLMAGHKSHYVDNIKFTKILTQFVKERKDDETLTLRQFEEGDYIGHCMMEICNNLANKANFINYTYKDEMISDGIENCIKSAKGFDPEKSKNAFGYFTQIAFNAFVRRIQKENRQRDKKNHLLSDTRAVNEIIEKQFDSGMSGSEHENNVQHFVDQIHAMLSENEQLIEITPPAPKRKKIKKVSTSLSKLL